jgi:ribosomal protein S18 acetylase RimI-like enzyme
MIESGYIKRNKGSCLQADLRYEMRFMDEDNLDEMMNLQEIVNHHLADKEIFRTHSADYLQEHLQIEKSAIGVFCQDGLIAYNILSFPGDSKDNFGLDINLPKDDLPNVVHLATIAVHPDFRGNSLQSKMQNAHLKLIANLGYEHVCCMVSPKNPPSLQNILSQGLIIKALKIKFPMENHINQKREAIYSPPTDGLFLPAFVIEMAPSSRISAFFLLPSFR